jgi:hypothetical protein
MPWTIRPFTRGGPLEISEAEYLALKNAREVLVRAIGQEERFTILIDNSCDFDTALHASGLRQLVAPSRPYADFHSERVELNRRLLNLTSAAKAYLDQLCSYRKSLGNEASEAIKAETSRQYDTKLGYRVMEAIRNVAQHNDQATHNLGYMHDSQGGALQVRAQPHLVVSKLEAAGMKAQIVRQLREVGPDDQLVTPYVREYLGGLDNIHQFVRGFVQPLAEAARAVFDGELQRAHDRWGPSPGLMVRDGREDGTFQVFSDLPRQWHQLATRSHTLAGMARAFVSTQS